MGMISVITKRPGEKPRHVNVSNSLEALQKNVGGYIEVVTMSPNWAVICNEEGRLQGMEHNCEVCGIDFVGPIIFAGIDGDEFCDLPTDFETFKKVFPELFEEEKK